MFTFIASGVKWWKMEQSGEKWYFFEKFRLKLLNSKISTVYYSVPAKPTTSTIVSWLNKNYSVTDTRIGGRRGRDIAAL